MNRVRLGAMMIVIAIAGAFAATRESVGAEQPARPSINELATTVKDGFTIASVGDMILGFPLAQSDDPGLQGVIKLLRDADVATGNYEGNIIDGRTFKGSGPGGFAGVPEVAADTRAMGFDLVARSNNHQGEYGYEGMLETNKHLADAGVVYAGSGETYWAARAPRFVATAKGRVGMVATASSYAENIMAQPGRGEWLGRGGQSALRTTRIFLMPQQSWQAVKTIRESFPNGLAFYTPTTDTATQITILGQRFRQAPAGVTKPSYTFEMNEQDLKDILAMVREGKTKSDFMTVAIHAHHFADAKGSGWRGPNMPETDDLDTNPSIADYLPVFAKAAIDAGADAFLGTGVHVVRGIEIYKGRPIFYGLGEFVRQMDVVGLAGLGRGRGTTDSPPVKYEGIVPVSRFVGGQLAEVRLHPIELLDDVRMVHRGVPRLASPATAQRVLSRLQSLSAPLGTTIVIDRGVGVISPKPTSSF
jgi:poly-gamma-glutamate synthesis protein (capsule biosynthesis protein)